MVNQVRFKDDVIVQLFNEDDPPSYIKKPNEYNIYNKYSGYLLYLLKIIIIIMFITYIFF
jgi:hypothetical protein